MQIKRIDNGMLMSSTLVCFNYSDMKHFNLSFEKISDNEFKCNTCGTVMAIKEPILVHDEKGKLKMQIAVESKKSTIDTSLINKSMQKTISEWLSIHIANKEEYAKKTKEFIDQLTEKVAHFEKVADELQAELIEKDEKIQELRDVIKDAVSIAEAQHENFLFEPWNSLKDIAEKFTNSK